MPDDSSDSAFNIATHVHEVRDWDHFQEIWETRFRRKRGRWYFRGQLNSSWTLQTTLERLLLRVRERVPNAEPYPRYPSGRLATSISERVELVVLRAFQARATKFLQNLPERSETLEWLALMRHWGLPTRVLDVTTSIHVAMYFALSEFLHSEQPGAISAAVWAINHVPLRATGATQAGVMAHTDLSDPALFNLLFFGEQRRAFVAPVHPRTHSDRLAAQQGTFLCLADVNRSLEHNVTANMPPSDLKRQSGLPKANNLLPSRCDRHSREARGNEY